MRRNEWTNVKYICRLTKTEPENKGEGEEMCEREINLSDETRKKERKRRLYT